MKALYLQVCALDTLRFAYTQIEAAGSNQINPECLDGLLVDLTIKLREQTYQPEIAPRKLSTRDLVVQHALRLVLDDVFAAPLPPRRPSDAKQWICRTIEAGQSRVCTEYVEVRLCAGADARLIKALRARVRDLELVALFQNVLAALREPAQRAVLEPLLVNIAMTGVDRVLEEAWLIGRREDISHVSAARFGTELVVLVDSHPSFDWALPAVRRRLLEALRNSGLSLDEEKTQQVDLQRGEKLRFLGHEFRYQKRGAAGRVLCRSIGNGNRDETNDDYPEQPGQRIGPLKPGSIFAAAIYSLLVVRQKLRLVARAPWGASREVSSALLRGIRRLGMVTSVCLLLLLISGALLIDDLSSRISCETAASGDLPGFFWGRYCGSWDAELVDYALYVPPHLNEAGRLPLIVYLHGYGQRLERSHILGFGLPVAVRGRMLAGEPFDFAVLFARDPKGAWGECALDHTVAIVDHVVSRHDIDPDRLYLMGISSGSSGVWSLAEKSPDRWAAIVPLGTLRQPNIAKLRHMPIWMFHGELDKYVSAERARKLVAAFRDQGTSVRYTEYADARHDVGSRAYSDNELYQWLGKQRRR